MHFWVGKGSSPLSLSLHTWPQGGKSDHVVCLKPFRSGGGGGLMCVETASWELSMIHVCIASLSLSLNSSFYMVINHFFFHFFMKIECYEPHLSPLFFYFFLKTQLVKEGRGEKQCCVYKLHLIWFFFFGGKARVIIVHSSHFTNLNFISPPHLAKHPNAALTSETPSLD